MVPCRVYRECNYPCHLELNRISFSSRASFHRTDASHFFPFPRGNAWPSFYPSRSTFRERSRVSWTSSSEDKVSRFDKISILIENVRFDHIEGRIFFVSKKYLTRPLEINCWSWWIARIVARSRWWNSWQNRGSHATVVRINWFIVIYDRRADAINRLRWLLYQLALVAFRPRTTAIHSAPSTIDPTFSHRICSMKFISTL